MVPTTEQAAEMMMSFLNTGASKLDALVQSLMVSHRCLQQIFTMLCVKWLERLAKEQGDGRNTKAILLARAFVTSVPKATRHFNMHTAGPEGIGPFNFNDE